MVLSRKHAGLIALALLTVVNQAALAVTTSDLESKVPDNSAINQIAKSIVNQAYIDSLKSAATNFRDYQCYCELFTKKENKWKNYGGAQLYYKQHNLLRAEIKSTDYRNGSVVVKQPDGKIRGKGGGGLSLVKMTIQPDSRTIRLPTGFSLVESDFISLYDALKTEMANGAEIAVSSTPIATPILKDPALVLVLRNKAADGGESQLIHVVYLNPKTKIPLAWSTYANGQSHAFVFFDQIDANKGLTEELFKL